MKLIELKNLLKTLPEEFDDYEIVTSAGIFQLRTTKHKNIKTVIT